MDASSGERPLPAALVLPFAALLEECSLVEGHSAAHGASSQEALGLSILALGLISGALGVCKERSRGGPRVGLGRAGRWGWGGNEGGPGRDTHSSAHTLTLSTRLRHLRWALRKQR